MHKDYDITVGSGKTEDARKKQPKAAGTSNWEVTMTDFKMPKANTGGTDPRKKVARPAATSSWEPTMI